MSIPQLEDGYTRIANELLEAIAKVKLPNEAMRIFLAIMRLTYGWNRKEAVIRNYELSEITGINRHNVVRAITKLTTTKMVFVIQPDNKSYPKYCINKNYEEWNFVIQPDNMLSNQITHVIQPDNKVLSDQITTTPLKPLHSNGYSDPKEKKEITKEIKEYILSETASPNRTKQPKKSYSDDFEKIWTTLPQLMKVGKKNAYRHYKTSVKTKDDYDNLKKALENYQNSRRFLQGYVQNGSTWFNNWQDWIDYHEPEGIKQGKKIQEVTPAGYTIYTDGTFEYTGGNSEQN